MGKCGSDAASHPASKCPCLCGRGAPRGVHQRASYQMGVDCSGSQCGDTEGDEELAPTIRDKLAEVMQRLCCCSIPRCRPRLLDRVRSLSDDRVLARRGGRATEAVVVDPVLLDEGELIGDVGLIAHEQEADAVLRCVR